MKFKVLWIAGLMLVATAGQVYGAAIFSTGLQTGAQGTGSYSGGSTQFKIYDDFSLASTDTLRSVQDWQVGVSSSMAMNLGTFEFRIYQGNAFNVGSLIQIYSQTLTVADYTAITDTGLTGVTHPTNGTFFRVSFDLSAPLALLGSTNYALSMYTTGSGNELRWGNTGSGNGFNQVYQTANNNLVPGNTPITLDNAFLGSSAAVPEPASIAMWGVGAIGLVFARRKRQQGKLAA